MEIKFVFDLEVTMEIKDAIERIKWRIETAAEIAGKGEDGKALEDLEMAVRALEKQKAVKPIHVRYYPKNGKRMHHMMYCGVCGEFGQRISYNDVYCRNCGTRVDWRIKNEKF